MNVISKRVLQYTAPITRACRPNTTRPASGKPLQLGQLPRAARLFSNTPDPVSVKPKRVADLFVNYLRQQEVPFIFGITGKTITPMFDAPQDYLDIRTITAAHEGGAAYMAYGYAQASGKLGVICTTSGGATTNAVTGVTAGYMNSLPMLIVSGQVPTTDFGKNAFQESTGEALSLDSVALFKPITKHSSMLINPEKAGEYFRNAIRIATTGRPGPVHINIPMDVQLAPTNETVCPQEAFLPSGKPQADPESVQKAVSFIQKANHPVFLMGWGAVMSGANVKLIALAEQYNIPVITTIQGKGGIPTNHRLCLGAMGLCGHQPARDYLFDHADLLIAVGTKFGEFGSDLWDARVKGDKPLIQIDIEPREIGRNYPVDVGLVGDAGNILVQIEAALKQEPCSPKEITYPLSESRWDERMIENPEGLTSTQVPIHPLRVIKEIRDNTPDNTIFTSDSGSNYGWGVHGAMIYEGGMFFPIISLGSMGTAIVSSIGHQLARPNQPHVCICGDGGMLMHGNEVSAAVHYNIPVIWAVLNDQRYNMPYVGTAKLYGKDRIEPCLLPKIDFAAWARAFGANGIVITQPNEITTALPDVLSSNRPTVLDIRIDPNPMPPIGMRLKYGQK